tara:strand:- start:2793 stop:3170 length:378 start_codon:yes stop_codon:yes gene_type:complete
MFHNRLRFSATYYDQLSEDLLVPIQVSAATGVRNVWDNIADMKNSGVELQLGGTIIKKEDFTFDIDVNFAKNQNEVTSLGELDSYILGGQQEVNFMETGVVKYFHLPMVLFLQKNTPLLMEVEPK